MIILIVHTTVQPGTEEECKRIFREMVKATHAAEPGCLQYIAQQSTENPLHFVIYEQYADEAALKTHSESSYFAKYIKDGINPKVVTRVREFFKPLD